MTKEKRAKRHYGIKFDWYSAEDREEVREYHARLFRERYDRDYRDIPGLRDSLQHLVDAGYSYQDISVMLGVPRHYVYRWCQALDVDTTDKQVGGAKPRVWLDEEQRFVAVDRDGYVDGLVADYQAERRAETHRNRLRTRYEHVRVLQEFVRRHGRPPSRSELREAIGTADPGICYYWGYKHRDGKVTPGGHPVQRESYPDAFTALYRAAGYPYENGDR